MNIFTIDPRLDGAWALTVDGRADSAGDMPVFGIGTRKRISTPSLANHMRSFTPDLCVIESVHPAHGNGVAKMFRSGMAFGAALAVPGVLGVPVKLVAPKKWRLYFDLDNADTETGRRKAIDLCPWLADSLKRKRDARRASAVLIGLYAATIWNAAKAA